MDLGDVCPKVEVPECIIASSAFSERAKVTSVCWSPDSSKLAATSDDGFVKIFSVEDSIGCNFTHTVHRDIGREVSNRKLLGASEVLGIIVYFEIVYFRT